MKPLNGSAQPSPPKPKAGRTKRKFVVFELIGTRTGADEEDVRAHLPEERVFRIVELVDGAYDSSEVKP